MVTEQSHASATMSQMTLFDVSSFNDSLAAGPPEEPEQIGAPADTESAPVEPEAPEVEVRVSTRRRKTSEARWESGRIVVSLPAHLDVESRQKTTDWLVDRLMSRHRLQSSVGDAELLVRANMLSERYALGAYPASVRWVTNQKARWGSCSYHSKEIRISHRLRVVPQWVLDSVLVHELAHLRHPDHSPAFHRLAGAYPRHQEAASFLAGYGLGLSNPPA
jgi:predicted metal-dependent hydrolase